MHRKCPVTISYKRNNNNDIERIFDVISRMRRRCARLPQIFHIYNHSKYNQGCFEYHYEPLLNGIPLVTVSS